ncbi:hypothetical protein [Lentzea jiangxiensis]|uniref:hypothetical protein n=1 Tax=Lentzea jiangxiensis TaxID=641025 RepID=UPI00115FEAE5|nr:hypothetical protein [Lentzea jiangxiensis]
MLTLAAVTVACLSTTLPVQSAATAQDKKTFQLGDLDPKVDAQSVGAAFDPCSVGWDAMPPQVRSATNAKPKLRAPDKDDVFAVGCRYDNGDATVVTTEQGGTPKQGRNFIVLIVWAKPGQMKTAQSDHQGAQPAQFGSKAGLLKAGMNRASQEASCTAIMPLANGTAAISITNGRFPQVDTCVVAKSIGTAIAEKTP